MNDAEYDFYTSVASAARHLFDAHVGWSRPHAPPELWAELGAKLYGEKDPRVVELRMSKSPVPVSEEMQVTIDLDKLVRDALISAATRSLKAEAEQAADSDEQHRRAA